MQTITFKQFVSTLTEELHPELKKIANADIPIDQKNSAFAKKVKQLGAASEDTGLTGTKHSGSSRVYFPHKEEHEIDLDGQKVKIKVGTKFAKRFALDKHTGDDELLGQAQNRAEHNASVHHALYSEDSEGKLTTNPHGCIAPVIHAHDHYDHITSAHCDKFSAKEFHEISKTKEHPKGIKFGEMQEALMRHHDRSNGKYHKDGYKTTDSRLDEVEDHPIFQKFQAHQDDTGHHPGDIRPANMGMITHPITGERHAVLTDAGYDSNVAESYINARKAMAKKRNYY